MDDTSPIDDPNKVAFAGSTTWAPGSEGRMVSVMSALEQIISDLCLFKCNPSSFILNHLQVVLEVINTSPSVPSSR